MGKKHTPGPWYVSEERGLQGEVCYHAIKDSGESYVASTWAGANAANASLIAAAPDLLEALEALMPQEIGYGNSMCVDSYLNAVVVARAAIAKAKGET